jgi:hypothetical protein
MILLMIIFVFCFFVPRAFLLRPKTFPGPKNENPLYGKEAFDLYLSRIRALAWTRLELAPF